MRKFFPNELARLQYLFRWVIWLGMFFAGMYFVGYLDKIGMHNYGWPLMVSVFVWLAIKLLCLDAPRLRNIGWSPWLLLLFCIPILYAILQLFLFTRPAEEA